MHMHRHLCVRETLRERREIWYTDTVQRVLFDSAWLGMLGMVYCAVHVQRTCMLFIYLFIYLFIEHLESIHRQQWLLSSRVSV